ncbi:MAG: phosphoserine phosphatase SerB [Proteobacteria bacterium]|nr:phosphoserine phosphatase SerB [Pseudomonadota bacterium]
MPSYVLTLIGNMESVPLESVHIERVYRRLATTGETDWLAEREACDLFIDSPLSAVEIAEQARDALSGTAIDTVCTSIEGRRRKLLISDMDSTVIDQECIDELGDAIGVGSQIREITAAVVNGDISFSDALRKRLALMIGMDRRLLKSVYEERISLKAGARTLVQTMRHHGAFCILVSGGFSYFTRRIAERIGFHDHQGNELAFADGKLTGEVLEPILGRSAKLNTLRSLCDEKGLEPSDVLAVGDGANDIKMIEAAGLGVAFHGSDSLKKRANARIDHGDLTALLYIQGFRKSEFVLS